jgi:serine/threonine-protein kinase RsbW
MPRAQRNAKTGTVTEDRLDLRFPSDAENVRQALAGINGFLCTHPVTPDERATTEIVMAELFNNIVEHAYAHDQRGMIHVEAGFCAGALCVQVSDQGAPMPDGTAPKGVLPGTSGPLESLPEGGFGWFLLHSLTENLRYCREGCTNITRFAIPTNRS